MGRPVALSNDSTVTGRLSLVTQVRNQCDIQNSNFFSAAELAEIINQELPEVHDELISAYGSRYSYKSIIFNLLSGIQDYDLYTAGATDFYRLWRVETLSTTASTRWIDVPRYDEALENVINNWPIGFPTPVSTPLRYNLRGGDPAIASAVVGHEFIHFVPLPYLGGQQVRVSYAPICPVLVNAADTYDFIDGWETIVKYGACEQVSLKQNLREDAAYYAAKKQAQIERLRSFSERDVTQAEQVHDVEGEMGLSYGRGY